MSRTLKEIHGELENRRVKLHTFFEEAGKDLDMTKVKVFEGDSTAKVAAMKAVNDEIDALKIEAEPLEAELSEIKRAERYRDQLSESRPHPGHAPGKGREREEAPTKSLGEIFVESKAGHDLKGKAVEMADVDVKTLMSTDAGWAPQSIRTGRLVDFATRPIQVIDIIPGGSTNQAAVVYMEETTFTNAAAEVSESSDFPESALALTERSEPVRKIATWLPVTDEQLEDVQQAQGYINNRLPFMLRQRLDLQILVGDGSAPNLSGFLDRSIQTQATSTDPVPDAVYKALTKVRVTGQAQPSATVWNPNDWQDVRLLKTADGIYIWGSPSEAGPARIWGLPVVEAQALTENTVLVGDFANFSELTMRRGIELRVTDSHASYFIAGKQVVRADVRAALCVYRPYAFCSVTGA